MHRSFFHVIKLYSDLGFDLIVPYMFFKNSDTLQDFRELLDGYPVIVVNISCPVEELKRRETKRANRKVGSAEEQLNLLETDFENSLTVDNFENTNDVCADKIIYKVISKQ